MFKYSVISLDDLQFIANRLDSLDVSMACNTALVKQLRLALPTCYPFSARDCIARNSEYRVWCALRDSVLTQIKEIERG